MSSVKQIPEEYAQGAAKTAEKIKDIDRVLIAAHVNMDGDALGSIAACGWMLKSMGRQFALYSSTGVPRYLKFLNLPGPVYDELAKLPFMPASAIYIDCSEPFRLGNELGEAYCKWPSINIDHHICERGLGSLFNFIHSTAAAASQLVAYTAISLGMNLDGALADCLALGLMTDTGGFCHGNTTADVFSLCSILARNGCNIPSLREMLQNNWSLDKLHLWGFLLSKVRLSHECKIAFCDVSLRDMQKFHCSAEDLEGLVEWLRKIKNVEVAAILREESRQTCKLSLRSFGDVDVAAIASGIGGGGHRNAAGGTLRMPLDQAESELLKAISRYLTSRKK